MTERLYYTDSYVTEFEAEIAAKRKLENGFGIVLNRTCFYPSSGGQEHDVGTLNGVEVVDVVDDDGEVVHVVMKEIAESFVKGKIDWGRRFDNMQQHTGQHILSRAFIVELGCDTVSAHLGEEVSTIDVDKHRLSYDDVKKVEDTANRIVTENRDVVTRLVDRGDLDITQLRKMPRTSGTIRIVEVDGFDVIPCGGTHCRKTGEVGIIKIRKWEKVRSNFTRVEFYCGKRALVDYQWKNQMINETASALTIKDSDLKLYVERTLQEAKEKLKKIDTLTVQLVEYEAKEIFKSAALMNDVWIVKKVFQGRSIGEVRQLAQKVVAHGRVVILFGVKSDKAYLLFARSPEVNLDLLNLFSNVIPIIDGKGGGRSDFVQGGGERVEKLEEAIEFAYRNLDV